MTDPQVTVFLVRVGKIGVLEPNSTGNGSMLLRKFHAKQGRLST